MKQITVSGAIIIRTNPETQKKEVFATQRGYGDWKGWWEFPGGKLETNETPQECIVREIREELAIGVCPLCIIDTIEYDYPEFHLTMYCILCSIKNHTEPKLLEHDSAVWLTKEALRTIKWLPADLLILDKLEQFLT